jgi:hypothetical protein
LHCSPTLTNTGQSNFAAPQYDNLQGLTERVLHTYGVCITADGDEGEGKQDGAPAHQVHHADVLHDPFF